MHVICMWLGALNTLPSESSPVNLYLLISSEVLWYVAHATDVVNYSTDRINGLLWVTSEPLFISWSRTTHNITPNKY